METPIENKENETKTVRGSLYETTRLVLLAGIGAISLAQDEMNNFVDRLVERGEMAEADARKLVKEVMDRREKLERERRMNAQAAKKPAPATRSDIEALNARIAELTREIEALKQQNQA